MLINKGPSSTFTLHHVAKYFQIFHVDFLDYFESFEFNRTQQKVLSVKLQISSLFETQMASCRMMKRMRLGSSVYLLLRAFIVIIRNEKEFDNVSNGVASSSIPVHKMLLSPNITGENGWNWTGLCQLEKLLRTTSLLQLLERLAQCFVHNYDSIWRMKRRSIMNQNLDQ